MPGPRPTQTLVYDLQDRLQAITGAGADLSALYDADGVRVKRALDSTDTYCIGDGYELTDTGTTTSTEVHITLAGQLVGSFADDRRRVALGPTARLKTGMRVTVDGNTGNVELA